MQDHFISRIYDHYFEVGTERLDAGAFLKARALFFGKPDPILNEQAEGLFNEWILFEHRMRPPEGGEPMTLLERWIAENPKKVGSMTMRKYTNLAEHNRYDWYEVTAVRVDSGLTLRALRDGSVYDVREKSGTHQVKPGNIIVARVGQIEEWYELVGADCMMLPSDANSTEVIDLGTHLKNEAWGVMDTYRLFYADPEGDDDLTDVDTYAYREQKVIAKGDELLDEIDLGGIITFSSIAERIREVCEFVENGVEEEICADAFAHPARLLLGLAEGSTKERRTMDELFGLYSNLLESIIFGRLSAMTPYAREKYEPLYDACAVADIEGEHLFAWKDHYLKCMKHLEKDRYEKALVEANAMCEALFTQGVVPRPILMILITIMPVYEHAGHHDSAVRIMRAFSALCGMDGEFAEQIPELFEPAPVSGATKTPADTYVAWVLTQGLDFTSDMPPERERARPRRARAQKKKAPLKRGVSSSPRTRTKAKAGTRTAPAKK